VKGKNPIKLNDPLHSAIFRHTKKSNKVAVMPAESISDGDPETEEIIASILAPHSTMRTIQAPPIASNILDNNSISKSLGGASFFGSNSVTSISSKGSKGSKESKKMKPASSVKAFEAKSNLSPHKMNVPTLDSQTKNVNIVSSGITIRASLPPIQPNASFTGDLTMTDLDGDDSNFNKSYSKFDKNIKNQEEEEEQDNEERIKHRQKRSKRNEESRHRRRKEKLKPLSEQDEYYVIDQIESNAKNRRRRRRHRDSLIDDNNDSKDALGLNGPGSFINVSADDKLGNAMASRGLAFVSNTEAHQDLALNKYLASVPPPMETPKTDIKSINSRNEPLLKGFDNNYRSLQQQHKNIAARLQPLQFMTPVNSRSTVVQEHQHSTPETSVIISSSILKQALPPLSSNDDKISSKAPGAPISDNDKGYQPRYPMWN